MCDIAMQGVPNQPSFTDTKIQEYVSTLSPKGQVTIPAPVRLALGVKPKDQVLFKIKDGTVELLPSSLTLESTYGAVPAKKHPEDFKELRDQTIEQHIQRTLDQSHR